MQIDKQYRLIQIPHNKKAVILITKEASFIKEFTANPKLRLVEVIDSVHVFLSSDYPCRITNRINDTKLRRKVLDEIKQLS